MTLHPHAEAFLDVLRASDLPRAVVDGTRPVGSAIELRAALEAFRVARASSAVPDAVVTTDVENRTVPGPSGGRVPVRLYRPDTRPGLPVLVYFHGGGWVTGGLESHDRLCRAVAAAAGCIVAAVDYRLAPEHKYPAAVDDADAAVAWFGAHAVEVGGDPDRIAVGGDSAGGNLATVVSRIRRDRGDRLPVLQVLIYPVTDFDFDTESYRTYAHGYHLGREIMIWFRDMYLDDPAQVGDPSVAPLHAELSGLPPALVITAECDVLCTEAERYVTRLRAAGVPVDYSRYDGMIHSFTSLVGASDVADAAVTEIAQALRAAFATSSGSPC